MILDDLLVTLLRIKQHDGKGHYGVKVLIADSSGTRRVNIEDVAIVNDNTILLLTDDPVSSGFVINWEEQWNE